MWNKTEESFRRGKIRKAIGGEEQWLLGFLIHEDIWLLMTDVNASCVKILKFFAVQSLCEWVAVLRQKCIWKLKVQHT